LMIATVTSIGMPMSNPAAALVYLLFQSETMVRHRLEQKGPGLRILERSGWDSSASSPSSAAPDSSAAGWSAICAATGSRCGLRRGIPIEAGGADLVRFSDTIYIGRSLPLWQPSCW
jgi:hypothetical protein